MIEFSIFFFPFIPDIVNSKLGMPRPQIIGQSISQQGFFSSRDSLSVPCVSQPLHSYSTATSDMDLSRRNESKSSSKLKPGEQPLLGSWNPSTGQRDSLIAHPTATSASTNHLTSNNGNGVNNSNNADRYLKRNKI
jgi:cyclic nucleotide gated channel alpha 3